MSKPELPEGFVAHDGGPCPVPLDSKPDVLMANGQRGSEISARVWAGGDYGLPDLWKHGGKLHIIAYRPELSHEA